MLFYMKKTNKKTPLVFRAGVVLLCALMISFHLTSGLYARYTESAIGSSGATIASFDMEIIYNPRTYNNLRINLNSPAVYVIVDEFQLHNSGDVSMS